MPKETEIKKIWSLAGDVYDPEVPVLSLTDLGIIRKIEWCDASPTIPGGRFEITITPTYSGCPAMDVIRMQLRMKLIENGYRNAELKTELSPAWTTDWMSEEGKQKLKVYGIAPPNPKQLVCTTELFQQEEAVQCPHCLSYHTRMISQFGSTACKALYQCLDCKEPFDYFKCH